MLVASRMGIAALLLALNPTPPFNHPPPRAQVRLGPNGVEEFLPIGPLSEAEQAGLEKMKALLQTNITTGACSAVVGAG